MPKRPKRKGARQNARRPRTRDHFRLLDLSDDVLVKVLRLLGLSDDLTPYKLRRVAPAFQLAATCTRLFHLFMNHVVSVVNADDFVAFSPRMRHPSQSVSHLTWLLRHTPNIRKLQLSGGDAHLLANLPRNLAIEELNLCNLSNTECTVPQSLPRTLKTLDIELPSSSSISYLATLHARRQGFQLRKLSLNSVNIRYAPQLRKFFSHSAGQMEDVLLLFAISLETDQRPRDNEKAVEFVRETCNNFDTDMPHLKYLALGIDGPSRLDGDWGHLDLPGFLTPANYLRSENMSRLGNTTLQMLFVYTDASLMSDWFEALGGAITPSNLIMLEAGFNMITLLPPFLMSEPGWESGILLSRMRINTLVNKRFPTLDTMRSSLMKSGLQTLYVTDRFVVDQWFYFSDEHRDVVASYLGLPAEVDTASLTFPFGEFARRVAMWDEEGGLQLIQLLTATHEERPEYVAFSFLYELVTKVKGLNRLEVSFEAVNHVVVDRSKVELMLSAMQDLTRLMLIMPMEKHKDSPIEGGLVDVTDEFIRGLPIFIYLLGEACPQLEHLLVQNLAEQVVWSDDCNPIELLAEAVAALDWLEQRRPEVDTETVRTLLEGWRSTLDES